jgi:hypothetical protein
MRAHGCPCSFSSSNAVTTTSADEHRDDDLMSGAHADENCAAAEEAGLKTVLPSARSTASATWLPVCIQKRDWTLPRYFGAWG